MQNKYWKERREKEEKEKMEKEKSEDKTKGELKELRKAYDIAMKEINKLRAKREYWELKYKKLEEKK